MQNSYTLTSPPTDILMRSADGVQNQLRAAARAPGESQKTDVKKAAQEFESLFVSYLLKVMRETVEESGLMEGGLGKDIYSDLFDQEVARGIAQQSVLGIGDMIYKRLSAVEPVIVPENRDKLKQDGTLAQPQISQTVLPKSNEAIELASTIPDFQLPLQSPISSGFGLRRDPFTHKAEYHKGLDIAAPAGMNIRAALGGEVVFSGKDRGYGNTVVIQHPDGYQTRYAHLADISVKTGDVLSSGDVLGVVGNTGHSTGPHLHFEVIRKGSQIDPKLALARKHI
jgi:murein DD-endopeptidase MepM/ murein hydrolase activator NlpD